MNTSITLTAPPQALALMEKLRHLPEVAVRAVSRGMAAAGPIVLGSAARFRFTGKGPFPHAQHRLGVRTNLLRKSLRVTEPRIAPDGRTVQVRFGSNVKYFAIHEFGFKGKVQVRAHTRRRKGGKSSKVKAHPRNLTIAARAPLGTELSGDRARRAYFEQIGRQLTLALQQNGGPA